MASSQFAFEHNQQIHIEAWAQETTQATLGTPARPTVQLEIPLDGALPIRTKPGVERFATEGAPSSRLIPRPDREPLRRDSLKRREALLKGKEGSRQRRRWENDRLLNNPWAQPPEPCDWQIGPTHRRTVVPYIVAPLWELEIAAKKDAEQKRKIARARANAGLSGVHNESIGHVPADLRMKLKRNKFAKPILRELEDGVRSFVIGWQDKQRRLLNSGLDDANSSEEDEIVFVGRNGTMHDQADPAETELASREKLIMASPIDDKSAALGRSFVHYLAIYYGLDHFSINVGPQRCAYVCVKTPKKHSKPQILHLPRPLWLLV